LIGFVRLNTQRRTGRPAMDCLMLVAERNGPTMMARIGIMRALNRHIERVFNPDRKDTHWGKRKLKRRGRHGIAPAPILGIL